ncbi:hypothetical protein BX600DRAFT_461287 [Xylariales sp. PMI_506]|nr:hypothetical protein BX600DRAFT_461287 [Xylariales sp. PMI_506]
MVYIDLTRAANRKPGPMDSQQSSIGRFRDGLEKEQQRFNMMCVTSTRQMQLAFDELLEISRAHMTSEEDTATLARLEKSFETARVRLDGLHQADQLKGQSIKSFSPQRREDPQSVSGLPNTLGIRVKKWLDGAAAHNYGLPSDEENTQHWRRSEDNSINDSAVGGSRSPSARDTESKIEPNSIEQK